MCSINVVRVCRLASALEPIEAWMDEVIVFQPDNAFWPGNSLEASHAGDRFGFAPLHIMRQAGIDGEAMGVTGGLSRLQDVHLSAEFAHYLITVVSGIL